MGIQVRVALASIALAGCITQIRRVDQNWDHASDPACTDTYGAVVGDGTIAVLATGGGLVAATQIGDRQTAGGVALAGLGVGLLFALLGDFGYDEIKDCERAKEEWRVARATARREVQAHRSTPPVATGVALPRGFFCAASASTPAAGLCARERSACEQARNIAVAAVPDMGACTLVETAWCFALAEGRGDRCSPVEGACAAQLERAGASAGGECEERR